MKWIGQHIWDSISRFRNDTYFEKDVYFQGDTVTFTSVNADDPAVIIENTTADAQAARLQFKKHRGVDAVDGDNIGEVEFWGYDDGTPSEQLYGHILTEIHDATSGQESGRMSLSVANHDGGTNVGLKLTGGSVNNEVDIEIGRGGGSVTDIQGTLSMGGTAAMTNAGLLSVANQSNITGLGTISTGVWQGTAIGTAYIDPEQTNITGLGTISTGVWQGDAIASAYLDTDTAHLSGTQSFTGTKSFLADSTFFTSATSAKPQLSILNSNSDTTAGVITFIKDKGAAGADGDDCGSILFNGDNSAQQFTQFSKILGEVGTAADTDEAGKLSFQVAASDGSTSNLRDTVVLTGSGANDIVDVSVGYGATSTTTVNGVLNVSGASSTFDCDTVTFSSSNADDPKIVLQNNTDDVQGARFQIKKSRVTGGGAQANNDNIAEIDFFGEDNAENQAQYAKILVKTNEVTNGQESGDFRIQVAAHDASLTQGLKLVGGSADGEVDVTVAAGSASVTTIAGDLTVSGSDLTFDSVALTAIQTSGETFADNDTSVMTSAAIDDRINAKYANSTISFTGQSTMLSTGDWVMPGKPGISSHTWNKGISVNTETNDSTTATIPRQWAHAGVRMPYACIIDGISCAIVNASGNRQVTVGLFFARASDSTDVGWGTTSNVGAKLQIHADSNNESGSYSNRPAHAEVTGSNIAMAAGDMFYPAIKLTGVTSGGNTDNIYASFTVHVKTLIS